ncbi:MAG: metal-dependent transcriptional regulator [Deltaproteobacteria bacterium]|jgi:DtxR family Mn-dependent transcriptional regulator|nr:metal-dependent transcriptional regulator [Deltaproteobacteria bacterium]
MLNEKQEEILESIWSVSDRQNNNIEAVRKRSSVDFTEADLDELEQQNLIVRDQDKISLANKGKAIAEIIIRRHRLAEILVSSILKLKQSDMEEMACKVEHSLLPEVEESICTLLGHPEFCPDGKRIPRGRCCSGKRKVIDSSVVSLRELAPGESGKITYIKPDNHSSFHQLISFGLHPGVVVTVHRKNPAFCIKFENTELALDENVAANIYVWKLTNGE